MTDEYIVGIYNDIETICKSALGSSKLSDDNYNSVAVISAIADSKRAFKTKLSVLIEKSYQDESLILSCKHISEHFLSLIQYDAVLVNQPSFAISLASLLDVVAALVNKLDENTSRHQDSVIRLEDLQRELADAKDELEANKESSSASASASSLSSNDSALRTALDYKIAELEDAAARIAELEEELGEVENRAMVEVIASKREKREAENQVGELEKALKALQQTSHQSVMASHGLQADVKAAQQAKESAEARAIELAKQVAALTQQLVESDALAHDLSDKLAEASRNRDAARAKCAELEVELRELDAAEAGMASAIQSKAILESQVNGLQSTIAALRRDRLALEASVEAGRLESEALRSDISVVQDSRDIAAREAAVLQTELSISSAENSELREKLARFEETRAELEQKNVSLSEARGELEKLKADLEASRDSWDDLRLENSILNAKISELSIARPAASGSASSPVAAQSGVSTDRELTTAKEKIMYLEASWAEACDRCDNKDEEIGQLKLELQGYLMKITTMEEAAQRSSTSSDSNADVIRQEVEALKAIVAERDALVEELKAAYQEQERIRIVLEAEKEDLCEKLAVAKGKLLQVEALRSTQTGRLSELEEQVATLQQALDEQADYEDLKKSGTIGLQAATEEVVSLSEELGRLKRELGDAHSQVQQKNLSAAELQSELAELKRRLDVAESNKADLEDHLAQRSARVAELEAQVQALEAAAVEMKQLQQLDAVGLQATMDEVAALSEEFSNVNAQLEEVTGQKTELEEILKEKEAVQITLEAEKEDLCEKLAVAKGKLLQVEALRSTQTGRLSELEEQVATLQQALDEQADYEDLKKSVAELEGRVSSLGSKDVDVDRLQKDLDEAQEEIKNLSELLQERNTSEVQLEEEKADLSSKLAIAKGKLLQVETFREKQSERIAELEEEMSSMQQELDDKSDYDEIKKSVLDLKIRYAELESTHALERDARAKLPSTPSRTGLTRMPSLKVSSSASKSGTTASSSDWATDGDDMFGETIASAPSPSHAAPAADSRIEAMKAEIDRLNQLQSTLTAENMLLVDKTLSMQEQIEQFELVVDTLPAGSKAAALLTSSPARGLTHMDSFKSAGSSSPLQKSMGLSRTNSMTNNPAVQNDRQFFVDDNVPIALLEFGEYMCRVGMWNNELQKFEQRYSCRTCKAVAQNDNNRLDVVRFASSHSDPMFQQFRDEGMFVGADAFYVAFDHPDRGLRGSLKLQNIVQEGRIIDLVAFDRLLSELFRKGLLAADGSGLQLLVSYKTSFKTQEMNWITQSLFENLGCHKVCLLNETTLIAKCVTPAPVSCIVLDIGASMTTVRAIYEGLTISDASRQTAVGGEHITAFLALLLHAKQEESYSTLLPRRCKEVAREVKETLAFVAEDFTQHCDRFGGCEFESIRVINNETLTESFNQGILKYVPAATSASGTVEDRTGALGDEGRKSPRFSTGSSGSSGSAAAAAAAVKAVTTAHSQEIRKSIECKLPDGTRIPFTIDIERFHCSEVLFSPDMFEECRGALGIVELLQESLAAIDDCVREEVATTIIVSGGTSCLAGLQHRLQKEIGLLKLSTASPVNVLIGAHREAESSFVPSCVMEGASARVRDSVDEDKRIQIEPQNFITSIDYETKGSAEICEALIS